MVDLSSSTLPMNPPPIISLGHNEEGVNIVFDISQLPTNAKRYWVIPVRLSPGIYIDWSTCTLQVHGVRGSVFQFYTSHILAVNTWWDLYLNDTVRVVLPGGSEVTQGSQPAKLTLAQLRINPEDYQKFYTDICAKGETPRAIVVFVGLKTGVFKD
ncbi:hypothetical protein NLI96_g7045 [Meripilus lineatus]|uniref:Ribonuclease H1 N-terminal domain-containing protein n=1 Tax=Meripilus lineatus TaxID=2056292 RepID=A0AAD5V037_9APHY|nr:hypothetical protein NLI96_g7045 [Physisporinus lineatus]